jgi:hypothetical protein
MGKLISGRTAAAILATAGLALALPASGMAAGHSQNGLTVGDCISDGLYGNEPNMANSPFVGPSEREPGTKGGNVLPTQSPGPFVNNPNDPDNPTRGRSVGGFMQDGISWPAGCRAFIAAQ